jgi:hypothetical protein
LTGKGQNVKNQNIKSLKNGQKFEKDQNVKSLFLNWSERQKWSGWSERQKSEPQKLERQKSECQKSECQKSERQKSERQKERGKSKMTFDILIFFDAIGNIRTSKVLVHFHAKNTFNFIDFTDNFSEISTWT